MTNKGKNKVKFLMDTDWMFDGIVDSEEKEYRLLSYFQKLNKNLDEMKVYPLFTEISLHLGNIQTLINQDKILYTDRELSSFDDELLFSDLKLKDIPVLAKDEYEEYQKILKNTLPKLQYYFQITKSIWTIVYDSIKINVKKNKNNMSSKKGFFYFDNKENLFVWEYSIRKLKNSENNTKTSIKLIYKEPSSELTISDIISNFMLSQNKSKNHKLPVFEIICDDIFPMEETLVPIFKRKVMSYISQTVKNENNKLMKLLPNGVQ
jgi:hypothetical protein